MSEDPDGARLSAHAGGHEPSSPTTPPDVAGFSTFYLRFTKTLVGFLIHHGAPIADAADIAQETMSIAWKVWPTIEHPEAWARTTAVRLWIRHRLHREEDPVPEVVDHTPLVREDADFAAFESRHDILTVLTELPPRQSQVLAWTLASYTPAEIATMLDLTPAAVRTALKKARRAVTIRMSGVLP